MKLSTNRKNLDQPGAYSNDQCTSVYVLSGIWFSHNCSYAKPFICKLKPVDQSACTTQLAPTKPPQGFTCPSGWTFYEPTQKCFTVNSYAYKGTTPLDFFEISTINWVVPLYAKTLDDPEYVLRFG